MQVTINLKRYSVLFVLAFGLFVLSGSSAWIASSRYQVSDPSRTTISAATPRWNCANGSCTAYNMPDAPDRREADFMTVWFAVTSLACLILSFVTGITGFFKWYDKKE